MFDVDKPLYDQTTYWGRFMHMYYLCGPGSWNTLLANHQAGHDGERTGRQTEQGLVTCRETGRDEKTWKERDRNRNEINKIITNIDNKEFKEAIHSCENLINLNIENTIVYNLCGRAYQSLGLYEKSIPKFEKSIADYCGATHAVAVNSATSASWCCANIEISGTCFQSD